MHIRRRRVLRLLWVPVVVVLVLAGVWFGGHPSWLPGPLRSAFVSQSGNDRLINQVLGLLQSDYYRKIDRTKLVNKGLRAVVASLDDPYSHYYDPTDYQTFQNQDTDPHDSGIGVQILPVARGLRVTEVFHGSPAAKAGLVRGDVIEAVGSTPLAHRSQDFAASRIKGKPGTSVTLTVRTRRQTRRVTVKRANLAVPVASGRLLTDRSVKLGYIALTSFAVGSGGEVRQQVRRMLDRGAQGLILDLRDNGGGLVDQAVDVASVFIPHGTIVSTAGRAQPRHVYLAKGDPIVPRMPLVVLVDSGTASAAEIVTAALQQRGRAKVIGTHTYGKGVFQEIQPLSNGGALDFTIGQYFTPDGQNLGGGGVRRGRGIRPDVHALSPANAVPGSRADTALGVAEKVVAAEVR